VQDGAVARGQLRRPASLTRGRPYYGPHPTLTLPRPLADFPSRLEVYVHRVGRTGRLAAAGHAFSFFTRALAPLAPPLLALLQVRGLPW
jgi:hypothetical protein